MGISQYPRRILSDPVSANARLLFNKRCKRFGYKPAEVLAMYINDQAAQEKVS